MERSSLDQLCATIAGGGTLAEWCKARGVLYRLAYEWVHGDVDHLKAYAKALEARAANLTDRVIGGFRTISEADPRLAFDAGGKLLPIHKLPDSIAMASAGVEVAVDDDGEATTKLRLNSRDRALESLGRHLGMFKDRLEVSGSIGFADRLRAARHRASQPK